MSGNGQTRVRAVAIGAAVIGLIGPIGGALAYWTTSGATDGGARAGVLGVGAEPEVFEQHGHNIHVRWAPSGVSGTGALADRYSVERVGPDGAAEQLTCALPFPITTCTDVDAPAGTWTYRVTPHLAGWSGSPSAPSAPVTIDPPSIAIDEGQFVGTGRRLTGVELRSFFSDEEVELQVEPAADPLAGVPLDPTVIADDDGNVGPFDVTIPTDVADGVYRLRAVGARGSDATSADFVVDTTPPSSTSDAPEGWSRTNLVVSIDATDAAPGSVAGITYQLGDGEPTTDLGPHAEVAVDASATLTWFATDAAGNSEEPHVVDIRIDPAPPDVTALVVPPYVRTGTMLSADAGDTGGSELASVQFVSCAGTTCTPVTPLGTPPSASPFGVAWPAGTPDGPHRVAVVATDHAGNVTTSTAVGTIVDNNAPTVSMNPLTIVTPSIIGRLVPMTATALDASGSGVASVRFEYSTAGGSWTPIATVTTGVLNLYGTTWDAGALTAGLVTLRAVATDRAGNSTTSAVVNATLYGPTTVQLANGGGAVGRIDQGDSIRVTFSALPKRDVMCPGSWNAGFVPLAGLISVNVQDGGADEPDRLVVTAANCLGLGAFGTVTLGSGDYVGPGGATFGQPGIATTSRIAFDIPSLTLTIRIGAPTSGTTSPVTTPAVATYTPSPVAVAANLALPVGVARTAADAVNF